MITTIETRLKLIEDKVNLIDSSIILLSEYFRKIWVMFNNKKFSENDIYAILSKTNDLTSCQIQSLINRIKTEYSRIKELTKTQKKELETKINHIEQFIKVESKRVSKNIKDINRLKIAKSIDYSKVSHLVNYNKKKLSIINNKIIKLKRLKKRLSILNKRIESNTFKLCFGSSSLFKQRPGHHSDKFKLNSQQKVYSNINDWEFDWDLSRNNVWFIVGDKKRPQGNAEIQYYHNSQKLRIRLPDKIALHRMEQLAKELMIDLKDFLSLQKYSSQRMFCRFIEIPEVGLNHRFLEQYLSALQNKQPITSKIVKKMTPNGVVGYYLQLSFEENNSLNIVKTNRQILGIDLNKKGLAHTIVKSDGNRLVNNNKAVNGFVQWDLENKSTNQRKVLISQIIDRILELAKEYNITEIAIENLDFSSAISEMNSGYKSNSKYNKMLTQFAKTQFKTLLTRKCDRLGLQVYLVNPSYSSVGGFIKYGLQNKCPIDIAASHWIARQALFGEVYKIEHNANYVKKHQETLSFPLKVQSKQSKRLNNDEQEWKDLVSALGKNRKLWISEFYKFLSNLNVAQAKLNMESNPFQT